VAATTAVDASPATVSNRYKATSIDTDHPASSAEGAIIFDAIEVITLRRNSHNGKKLITLEINMLSIFRKLMKNEQGATAIEYVLIASLISVAAIAAMTSVGGKVSNVLSNVANAMN
jgi:pilus assembly protein Flp/PilA